MSNAEKAKPNEQAQKKQTGGGNGELGSLRQIHIRPLASQI